MLAIFYLLIAVWIGDILCRRFLAFGSVVHRLASAVVVGLVVSTWINYLGAAVPVFFYPRWPVPLLSGNVLFLLFAYAMWRYWPRDPGMFLPRPPGRSRWDLLLVALWTTFASWMMWGSLTYKDGLLRMAVRQWSDFGATLAIVQSFAIGHNFPPEYPHFAGPPLSYHFLFHFQAANLEWLGLKLHHSFNLLAAASFVTLAVLLMTLGERITRSRAIGRVTALLFFFHCSLAYVPFLTAQPTLRAAWQAILHKDGFLESIYSYRGELWGIWTLNILANQRHLASGICLLLIVLIFLVDAYDWRLKWPLPPPPPPPVKPPVAPEIPAAVVPFTPLVEGSDGGNGHADAPASVEPPPAVTVEGGTDVVAAPVAPAADAMAPAALPWPSEMPVAETPAPVVSPIDAAPTPVALPAPEPGPGPVPGGSRLDLLLAFGFCGFLLGLLPLWNGPVFITSAVILAGLFILMPLRGYMVAMGAMAGLVGIPQLVLWRTGGAAAAASVYPMLHFGYVIEDPTLLNFIKFMAFTFGFKWLVVLAALVPLRTPRRTIVTSCLGLLGVAVLVAPSIIYRNFAAILFVKGKAFVPIAMYLQDHARAFGALLVFATLATLVFLYRLARNGVLGPIGAALFLSSFGLVVLAFFVQFSIESAANHKFLFIWIALINVGVATVLYSMARRGLPGIVAATLLTLSMTLGGFIDIFPFHNDGYIEVAMEHDPLMDWVLTKTDPHDVFLTDAVVTHTILLAGRKLYHGHDYYAWSAGYNTEERLRSTLKLYSERDPDTLVHLLNEPLQSGGHVNYVCFDEPFSNGAIGQNEWVYRAYFRLAFEDTDNKHDHFRVYKVPTLDEWAERGGVALKPVVAPTPTPAAPAPAPDHLSRGFGLAVASTGDLLVAEADSGAIQRISPAGFFVGGLGMPEYKEPGGVAVDGQGFVYVADTWKQRIVKLTAQGTPVGVLPVPSGGFYAPRDVAATADGNVYAVNTGRTQVVHYTPAGIIAAEWGSKGADDGQFNEPLSVTVGGDEVFVGDYFNARIQVFTPAGKFVRKWAVPEWAGAPTWERPGLAFHHGHVYVAAGDKHQVLVYSTRGDREGTISSPDLRDPTGLAVSADGTLYIMCTANGTIASGKLSPKTGLPAEVHRFAPPR